MSEWHQHAVEANLVRCCCAMGGRHSKRQRDAGAAAGELSSSSSAMDSEGREQAPPEMLAFLETTSGSKWLAGILLGMH